MSQRKSSSGGSIRGKLLAKSLFGLGSKSSKSRAEAVRHHQKNIVVNGCGGFYCSTNRQSSEVASPHAASIQKSAAGMATSGSFYYSSPGDANVDAKAATYISYVRERFMAERLDSEAW
ncbi:unnamed protein product [Linum trigynum]|uniref:Uncharacterized protein n=1 Tax=Linum trigynum TaxID=586398 RepID=A0AAV2GTH6_9ROSI